MKRPPSSHPTLLICTGAKYETAKLLPWLESAKRKSSLIQRVVFSSHHQEMLWGGGERKTPPLGGRRPSNWRIRERHVHNHSLCPRGKALKAREGRVEITCPLDLPNRIASLVRGWPYHVTISSPPLPSLSHLSSLQKDGCSGKGTTTLTSAWLRREGGRNERASKRSAPVAVVVFCRQASSARAR